jgi:ribosomal protein L28
MSRIDVLTGKGAQTVNSRSHSNIATRRRQMVNLQTVRINGRRIRVAASTIRTLRKMAEIAHGERPTKMQKKAAKKSELTAKQA